MRKQIIGITLVIILVVGVFGGTVLASRPGTTPLDAWGQILEELDVLGLQVTLLQNSVEDVAKTKVWQGEVTVLADDEATIPLDGENVGRVYLRLHVEGEIEAEDSIIINAYINDTVYKEYIVDEVDEYGYFEAEFNADLTEIDIINEDWTLNDEEITVNYIAVRIY